MRTNDDADDALTDPAAERGVLAWVYQNGMDAYADVAGGLTGDAFTDPAGAVVWRCFREHFENGGTGVDYATVLSLASRLGLGHFLDGVEDQKYLRSLANMPVSREGVGGLLGVVRNLEYARSKIRDHEKAIQALRGLTGGEPRSQVRAASEGPVLDGADRDAGSDVNDPREMGEGAEEYAAYLLDNPRSQVGISTGYPLLDLAIGGGIRENALAIIAARMKVGKTWVASNVAVNIAEAGVPVLQIDTEMPWEEHQPRLLGRLSGEEVAAIETGRAGADPASRRAVLEAARRLASLPYSYQYVAGMSFEEVLSSVRRWITRKVGLNANGKASPCIIIYDYLKMMSADGLAKVAEHQQLGFMTIGLKDLLGRYGVGGLAFVQLNRDGIDREDAAAVADSDKISRYCTSLTFYKKLSRDERAELPGGARRFTHKFVPVFSRYGEGISDEDCVYVEGDYKHGRILEGPLRSRLGERDGDGGFAMGPAQEFVL